ncbi:MAG TPA: hypothetical protein DCZ95_07570 [Verrucomicrobia bacterium]|nr:MAG: hypothetical protein A2X46_01240 [Lentisphaerae bacterium GWF2_57_35]HBA83934.1 hypothetical protein [Verrucomicrobiota bacterium]
MKTESNILDSVARVVGAMTGLVVKDTDWRPSRSNEPQYDGAVELQFGKQKLRQPYVAKRSLNATTIHLLSILQKQSPNGLLLVTTYVNDRQSDALRQAGVYYMDTAGNVFLAASGLHLLVSGRRLPKKGVEQSDRSKAFHSAGLRLLFSLLTDPHLDDETPGKALVSRPYREISAVTGLSHSTVGWVMADLSRQGMVLETEGRSRMLVDRARILERWVQGYLDRLRPRLVQGRFRPERNDWWQDVHLKAGLWSGEVAAASLTGMLKPGSVTIFGDTPAHSFILKHHLQKDPQGSVEFLNPFWGAAQPAAVEKKTCVHPLLVYADLLAVEDDRTHEIAQGIYEKYLRSLIETA